MALHMMPRTTNLLTANQSSVETDLTGFTATGSSISRVTIEAWHGGASLQVITDNSVAGEGFRIPLSSLTPSVTYTYSVYLKGTGTVYLQLSEQTVTWSGVGNTDSAVITLTSKWQRYSVTRTFGTTGTNANLRVLTNVKQGITFYADGILFEPKSYPTSWHLGDATRAPESLTIPGSVLSATEGTVECWVYFPPGGRWSVAGQIPTIFWAGDNSTGVVPNQIFADIINQGILRLVIYDNNGGWKLIARTAAITPGWRSLAYKWDSSGPLAIFVDGAKQAVTTSGTGTGICSTVGRFTLGFNGFDNDRQLNDLIDDLRISNRARTDAEILTGFNSNAPLPPDADTTAKFTFDGVLTNLFTNYTGLTAATIVPLSEQVYSYGHTGLTVAEALPSAEMLTVFGHEGLTVVLALPSALAEFSLAYNGLVVAEVIPSSDTRLMFTHQGLTAVNVLPLAGILSAYAHAGLVAVNVIPVAKWFFAPPPGVPQYMFSVPREADFYVR